MALHLAKASPVDAGLPKALAKSCIRGMPVAAVAVWGATNARHRPIAVAVPADAVAATAVQCGPELLALASAAASNSADNSADVGAPGSAVAVADSNIATEATTAPAPVDWKLASSNAAANPVVRLDFPW